MAAAGARWGAGFLVLAGLGIAADHWVREPLEARLAAQVQAAISGQDSGPDGWAEFGIHGRDVILRGEAPSTEDLNRMVASLQGVVGRGHVLSRATVTPPDQPPAVTAAWAAGHLSLSGSVPFGAIRSSLRSSAETSFPQAEITTNFGGARREFPGFDTAVAAGFKVLATLPVGSMTVSQGVLRLSGDLPDSSASTVLREARHALPAGFRLDASGLKPPRVENFHWTARRSGNEVVLEGYLPDVDLRDSLLAEAARLLPDAVVSDRMELGSGAAQGLDVGEAARFALHQLASLQSGAVDVRGSTLLVTGQARDRSAEREIQARLASLPAGLVEGKAVVTAARVSPYTWRAERRGDRLVLSGYMPDEQAQVTLRKLIQRRFVLEEIVDETRLGDGAPRSFLAGAIVGLERLAQLAGGELVLEGQSLRLEGESLYAQAAAQLGTKLAAEIPPGWTVRAAIKRQGAPDPMDPETCQRQVSETMEQAEIGFADDGTAFTPAAELLFDRLGRVLNRCPDTPVAVQVMGGEEKAKTDLAQGRVRAVMQRLVAGGIEERRLVRTSAAGRTVDEGKTETTGTTGGAVRLKVRL